MTEMTDPADPRPIQLPARSVSAFSPGWLAAVLLAGLLGGAAPGAVAEEPKHERGRHDATSDHPFTDPERWAKRFDAPERAAWQKPAEVAAALEIEPGMVVADIGAGTGYFLEHLSRKAGLRGMVLAIDTEAEMVAHMGRRMNDSGVTNVVPVLALPGDPFLPPGRVDRILIVDTYHHIDDRLGYFRRLRDTLTPGGRLAIIDFLKKPLPVGPPPDHKLERAFVLEEMVEAGWRLADEKKDLLPYQYFLIFEPLAH
jgi:ubiquinone/menaquinone biosynthesis C-methylase UbiE